MDIVNITPGQIAARIKGACRLRSMTLGKALELAGLGSNTIGHLTSDKHPSMIGADGIYKLSIVLSVTTDYLLCRSDDPERVSANGATEEESEMLTAYRASPEMQKAVNALLGL